MESTVSFDQVVSRGCGIDVHQKMVVATISGEGLKKETREFGTFTRSLTELRDWLLENGVTHAAMESTGVYWNIYWNRPRSRYGSSMPGTSSTFRGTRRTSGTAHGYASCCWPGC